MSAPKTDPAEDDTITVQDVIEYLQCNELTLAKQLRLEQMNFEQTEDNVLRLVLDGGPHFELTIRQE